jgi:hypothetical protein
MILEEFINFIEGIGFKLDVHKKNPLADGNTSFDFSYNGYNIYLTKTRFGLEHNIIGIIDSPSRTNQRNFDFSDLELLEIHFKSEIRNSKLKELGI